MAVARVSDDQVMRRATAACRCGGAGRGRSSRIRKRRGRMAPRVDGARCALRMRRGDATVSARQNMRYADALQTRRRARCRVPRTVSRPSEGSTQLHNLDWCRGAHLGRSRAQWSWKDPKLRYTAARELRGAEVRHKTWGKRRRLTVTIILYTAGCWLVAD